jgi:hypothetical protein
MLSAVTYCASRDGASPRRARIASPRANKYLLHKNNLRLVIVIFAGAAVCGAGTVGTRGNCHCWRRLWSGSTQAPGVGLLGHTVRHQHPPLHPSTVHTAQHSSTLKCTHMWSTNKLAWRGGGLDDVTGGFLGGKVQP